MTRYMHISLALAAASLMPLGVHAQKPTQAVMASSQTAPADSIPEGDDFDYTLDEVTVAAKKPVIQQSPGKLTYNADEDPASATSSVIDAMRRVPMLSVDAEGNVKLKGDSNFKIFINGKPDPAISANYKEILKGMPAASIQKIEVWTNPGAKYDAEGTGGIINIVTVSNSKLYGYTATVEANVSNRRAGGSVNAMAKVGNVSANLSYSHNSSFDMDVDADQSVTYVNNPIDHLYTLIADAKSRNTFDNGSLQISWEPNDKNLFNLSGNMYSFHDNSRMDNRITMKTQEGAISWASKNYEEQHGTYMGLTVGANYQHNFSTPAHNLVLSYQYVYGLNKRDKIRRYFDFEGDAPEADDDTRNILRYPSNEHTFQLDYTLPLFGTHSLEVGTKYIMRRNSGNSRLFMPGDEPAWVLDEDASVRMNQYQDIAAVYAVYTAKLGSAWTANAGLRYEYTRMGARFKTPGYSDFSQNLNNLVPNAMVTYMLTRGSSLTAAYQMRIIRPSIEQLNPYRDMQGLIMVQYGNPNLTSQKSNEVTLTYSNFEHPVGLNLSAGYKRYSDMIMAYRFLSADDILNSTYGNLGVGDEANLFGFMRWSPLNGLALNLNGGAYYKNFKASSLNLRNDGWGWNAGLGIDYSLPWNMQLTVYGGAGNSGPQFQEKGTFWHYDGIAISKTLLKEDRLKLTLSANSFITPTLSYNQTTQLDGATTVVKTRLQLWSVGIGVSYRLGSLSTQMKKTAKSINNDDLMQSSPSGSTPGVGNSGGR